MCARQKVRQEKGEFSRAPISCRSCAPGLFLLPQQLAPSPLCSRYYSISARADAIGCWRLVLRDSCGRWSARRASGAKVAFKSPFALKKWPHLPKNGNHSGIPPFDGRLSATQRRPKLQVRELGLAWSHVQLVHWDLMGKRRAGTSMELSDRGHGGDRPIPPSVEEKDRACSSPTAARFRSAGVPRRGLG